jgi:hypothetical protein
VLAFAIIVALVATTVSLAAYVLAPRTGSGRLIYAQTPDRPPPFGYNMTWLALRTRDTDRVVEALSLAHVEPANWSTGLGTVYSHDYGQGRIFVSPPVNGWIFVVGLSLPQPLGGAFAEKSMPLLVDLGATFIEVQYFSSCPDIDHFAWARIIDGQLVRAFAVGDQGQIWNKGKQTKEEKALGLKLFEVRGGGRGRGRSKAGDEPVIYPTEMHVMQLAAKWSLDPTRLAEQGPLPAVGLVGIAPMRWRAERLRTAA